MSSEPTHPDDGKSRLKRWTRGALVTSVVVHVIGIGVSGLIAVLALRPDPTPEFEAAPRSRPALNPRKLEMKVRVQDLQKRSARPKLQPRLVSTAMSEISLPEIKKKPKKVERKVKKVFAVTATSGFGDGVGGGFGTGAGGGTGGGVSFFGLQTVAEKVVFVVDFSASMKGKRDELMRKELAKSLSALPPQVDYQVICFSGPCWFIMDKLNYGKPSTTARGKYGSKTWKQTGKGAGDWAPVNGFPKGKYLEAGTRFEVSRDVKDVPLSWGTSWDLPLKTALNMQPKPDIIYFMTDGAVGNWQKATKEVTALNKKGAKFSEINCIALMEPKAAQGLAQLARQNRGKFNLFLSETKTVDGFAWLKNK